MSSTSVYGSSRETNTQIFRIFGAAINFLLAALPITTFFCDLMLLIGDLLICETLEMSPVLIASFNLSAADSEATGFNISTE